MRGYRAKIKPWSGQQDGSWYFPSCLASSYLEFNPVTLLFHGDVVRAQPARGQASISHHQNCQNLLRSLTSGLPNKWCDFSKLLSGQSCHWFPQQSQVPANEGNEVKSGQSFRTSFNLPLLYKSLKEDGNEASVQLSRKPSIKLCLLHESLQMKH